MLICTVVPPRQADGVNAVRTMRQLGAIAQRPEALSFQPVAQSDTIGVDERSVCRTTQ